MIRLGTIEDIRIIDPFDPFGGSREDEVSAGCMYVFADGAGGPVAYISLASYTFHSYPYITFLLVHPEHRRKGIATRLLDYVERLNSGRRIFISTESDNHEMLALLAKQQYERSGTLMGLNLDGAGEIFFLKDV